jgi:hypothetical protein
LWSPTFPGPLSLRVRGALRRGLSGLSAPRARSLDGFERSRFYGFGSRIRVIKKAVDRRPETIIARKSSLGAPLASTAQRWTSMLDHGLELSRMSSARTVSCDQARAPCAVGTASLFKSPAMAYAVLRPVRSRRPLLSATSSTARRWTSMLDHGLELFEVLRISMPTPRGQEAQLDQVVEAHRIAGEGRIDNASGKEEDDQDQFSSCVPTFR